MISVEEVQDNNGATDNGVVAADQTLTKLIAAIPPRAARPYDWREIDPVDDQDGGQPGGNIRQVFLFRTDRGLSFVDRPGGGSTDADRRSRAAGAVDAAHAQPGPDRPDERGLEREPQAARGRVHVPAATTCS